MNLSTEEIKRTRNTQGFGVVIEGAGRTTTPIPNLLDAIVGVYATLTLREIEPERILPWITVLSFNPEPEQNIVWISINPPCSDCGREINQRVFVNLSLISGPMNQLLACPCSKCGRLHWSATWLPVFNGSGGQSTFFKDGKLAHKNGDGSLVFENTKPQVL